MINSTITCIINGNAYPLNIDDGKSLQQLPERERQQLIALLETLKLQQRQQSEKIQVALESTSPQPPTINKPDRMSEGDIDALMEKLIKEERSNKKPPLGKRWMKKRVWLPIVLLILLIIIF